MIRIEPAHGVEGELRVPSDKSLTHRGILFGALAEGETLVRSPLDAADTRSSAACAQLLGAHVNWQEDVIRIEGGHLGEADDVLPCGNSGTTMRLMMGVLAGRKGLYVLDGDQSLRRRPMKRVIEPLSAMGATIYGRAGNTKAPIALCGGQLQARSFDLQVASAQVKSALLLAGLRAEGTTTVHEPGLSRDHTELLLPLFGASVEIGDRVARIHGPATLSGTVFEVPGDPSSAAFFLALAAILPGSTVRVPKLCLNRTRIGFLEVLRRYGAQVRVDIESMSPEPVGTVTVAHGRRLAVVVTAEEVPQMIDELPLVAVLGAYADGVTRVSGADELRHKESDRIEAIVTGLRGLGARIDALQDGFVVVGGTVRGGAADAFEDHRIAMALSVAAAAAEQPSTLTGEESVAISYPGFFEHLGRLTGQSDFGVGER